MPAPPDFSKDRVIAIDMPRHVTLKVGVDPDTIVVGADGVVRYVIVMVNSTGSVNAMYEGIRCASDEFKTYARWSSSGTWSLVANPDWREVNGNMPSRHTLAFARQGGCINRLAPSKSEIVQTLKSPKKTGITSIVN